MLVRAGLPMPIQQVRVTVGGRERILGFAYPEARWGSSSTASPSTGGSGGR